MTNTSASTGSPQEESGPLRVLTGYIELALDAGKCVVIAPRDAEHFTVYIGNPENEEEVLRTLGTIPTKVAHEILGSTRAGANHLTLSDQTYRFFRSFTHLANVGAVVFAPA